MARPLNILYAAADLFIPGYTGGSAHAFSVISSFLEEGHNVFLISTKYEDNKLYHPNLINFEITNHEDVYKKNFALTFRSFLYTIYIILTNKIDLIYERGRIFGGGAVLAGRLFRKPIIYEMNEPLGESKGSLNKLIKIWNKRITKRANLVTGMHEYFFKNLPKEKYVIITNAADPKVFSPYVKSKHIKEEHNLTKGKTILYSGSFAPWHACENIIEVAKKLVKKDKQIKFLLVGYGKKYETCKNLIEKYNLQNNVILLGKRSYSEMPAYTNAADICLALFDRNYHEYKKSGYYYSPVKLFEYLSSGKPVVASDIGNIRQLINKDNGFLVDENNIDEIVSIISKLTKNKRLYNKISGNNRKLILKKYNWKTINQTVLNELAKRSTLKLN